MAKMVTLNGEYGKDFKRLMALEIEKKNIEDEIKTLKSKLNLVFNMSSIAVTEKNKTAYRYGTINAGGKVAVAVATKTVAKGAVDYIKVLEHFGITLDDAIADMFRKPNNERTSYRYANDKELKELGLI